MIRVFISIVINCCTHPPPEYPPAAATISSCRSSESRSTRSNNALVGGSFVFGSNGHSAASFASSSRSSARRRSRPRPSWSWKGSGTVYGWSFSGGSVRKARCSRCFCASTFRFARSLSSMYRPNPRTTTGPLASALIAAGDLAFTDGLNVHFSSSAASRRFRSASSFASRCWLWRLSRSVSVPTWCGCSPERWAAWAASAAERAATFGLNVHSSASRFAFCAPISALIALPRGLVESSTSVFGRASRAEIASICGAWVNWR